MEKPFSDLEGEGKWSAPVADLLECHPVSFGEGKAVARASSTCSVLRGEAAKGR